MDNLFQNEIETLIKLAREAASPDTTRPELEELQEQIEIISKRLEGYFTDYPANSRNFGLNEDK